MLNLYFSPSSSSLATHIALIECGATFELVPRLIGKQETRTPEYLAINPDGKVPALMTEQGRVLMEVAATLYYLARTHPAASLWPEAEAEVISWMSFVASIMHGSRARGPEHVSTALAVADRKLGDRQWAIDRFSIADIHLFRAYCVMEAKNGGVTFKIAVKGLPKGQRGFHVHASAFGWLAAGADRGEGATPQNE
jgi:glutathione S-transferase